MSTICEKFQVAALLLLILTLTAKVVEIRIIIFG